MNVVILIHHIGCVSYIVLGMLKVDALNTSLAFIIHVEYLGVWRTVMYTMF